MQWAKGVVGVRSCIKFLGVCVVKIGIGNAVHCMK